jgi:hypothetical protein
MKYLTGFGTFSSQAEAKTGLVRCGGSSIKNDEERPM